jgi:amidase
MTVRPPTDAQLSELERELGLHLTPEERGIYALLIAGSLSAYAQIESADDALPAPAIAGPRRSWEPPAAENPLGAWFVRTEIPHASSGPLAGVRVALKDNVMLAGVPMLNGSAVFEGYVGEMDATVATRLLAAGAEIAGKAHCEDLCLSGGSHTNVRGPVHNPHRRGYSAGGSSSGSAALVGAGAVEMAIGGDQGGSIRMPSAFCGTVGMKPTYGLVPYTGICPIEPTVDHVGPITANVRDNARMLEVIAGPDGVDPRQSGAPSQPWSQRLEGGVARMRIAVVREGFGLDQSQPALDAKVRAAAQRLEKLGAKVEEVSIPEHRRVSALTFPMLVEGTYRTLVAGGQGFGRFDLYVPGLAAHLARWREKADRLSPVLKAILLAGAHVDHQHGARFYQKAVNQARALRQIYDRVLADCDLLLMPTAPMVATPLPAPDAPILERFQRATEMTGNTQPFDVTHHPALSVPCGKVDGLPVGMMLVGRHYAEETLYRAAYAFEQSEDWRES